MIGADFLQRLEALIPVWVWGGLLLLLLLRGLIGLRAWQRRRLGKKALKRQRAALQARYLTDADGMRVVSEDGRLDGAGPDVRSHDPGRPGAGIIIEGEVVKRDGE